MTVREMSQDDQLAALSKIRDYLEAQAAYWRRRAETPADRARAIHLEEMCGLASELLANWRTTRRAAPPPEA